MLKNLEELLREAARKMDISLGSREIAMFSTYYGELVRWNSTVNLVSTQSVISELDIPIKHFIDSLTPLPFLTNKNARILDIGSGAGFPGIPLKIVLPSLKISLMESSRKKTSFLKHMIRTLNLHDIKVIHNRVESMIQDDSYRERFDIVISRATFKLPDLLRQCAPFLDDGGLVIAMKGKGVSTELQDAAETSAISGLTCIACQEIRLPVTGDYRKIIIFKKGL